MPAVLVLAFLLIPILEIYVIFRVDDLLGPWPTVLLLLAASGYGAYLIQREGGRAWRALRGAWGTGRLPTRELADAALVLVGGTLMLTPGFLTDLAGLAFVLPTTRPVVRRILAWMLRSHLFGRTRLGRAVAAARAARAASGAGARRSGATGSGGPDRAGPEVVPPRRVVPGEVVEDTDRDDPSL